MGVPGHGPELLEDAFRERLAAPERPGRVRPLGFEAVVSGTDLSDTEVIAALRGQVDVRQADREDESVSRADLVAAFRAGFRSRRLGTEVGRSSGGRWRAIREGHHLQRASFRAGTWFYDEIFPEHVVRGSRVEVFGFRAQVQRVRLGLPEGASSSRQAADRRYAYVAFQVGGSEVLSLMSAPRAEWVPFSELRLVDQATATRAGDGCSACGAEACSAMESSGLPASRDMGVGPRRCGCCGAPWMGGSS
jgi:hypothetical protein